MKLKKLKTTDFKKEKKYNFLFPIGSTEQHGPFLPLGTDTYITDYLVNQVSNKIPKLVVLPTLEFSRSQEHRGFYGTLWLTEETLQAIIFDICNSIKEKAKNIFITSFHANAPYINSFIANNKFEGVNIIYLEILNKIDDEFIEKKILNGELDEHAGNSEISNMLVIDEKLVEIPDSDYPKNSVKNPFDTDNLIEKCSNGIADNHPLWLVNKNIGKQILDIYVTRMVKNIRAYEPSL